MLTNKFTDGIWLIDFEFLPLNGREGNPPDPVCMAVRQWPSGHTQRYWRSELDSFSAAPFATGSQALCVAYYASAEMDCFKVLGWPMPTHLLDLHVEFRHVTNGLFPPYGNGLLGALLHYGLPSIGAEKKSQMQELILAGGPWSPEHQAAILDYCETDVVALDRLLHAMQATLDLPRALLRGRYMQAVSEMQHIGVPIDTAIATKLAANWVDIQDQLISKIDQNYAVFEGRTFKMAEWEAFLIHHGIPWPRLASGRLDMSDATFKDMANAYPLVAPMRELRSSLSELRLSNLQIGDDGRNRCLLSPFRARTSRNQPSNTKSIFGPSVWLRGLIKPAPGWGLAYIDWSQQEFGIAAALSADVAMMAAYTSGDPYLAFAKQAGAVPPNATKATHEVEREQFKACVLAVQYGMGEGSLAIRINQPVARARQLLALHRQTYSIFWKWSDNAVDEAILGGRLWSTFGWQILTGTNPNDRSLRNFPMQANGAEMLRIACIKIVAAKIRICLPVHDALLIEAPLAELDAAIKKSQDLMREASRSVLGGFELGSDAKVIRYPDRFMDKRGVAMWNAVMSLIGEPQI